MNLQPDFRSNPGFNVVGIERYTENGIASIHEAWDGFGKRSTEIQHLVKPVICYGFEDYSRDFVMQPRAFPKYYYIASYEVESLNDIPAGMVGKDVAAANYAVFTYRGSISGLPKFFQFIYGDWLPASGYKMDPAMMCDFERYPEPVTDMENALVEIWVAVVEK